MRIISNEPGEAARAISAVDLEILRTTLIAHAGEMGTALTNTAPTYDASRSKAFAVAITDERGAVVAIDNPQQLGSIARTVEYVSSYYEFDLNDGDVIVTNDPYHGGTKVQDITLIAPLFVGDVALMKLVARVRINDMGGQLGGNLYPGAVELLAEGVPVTPIRIQRFGRPVRDLTATFLLNGRRREETGRVLRAAMAALELGKRRIGELISRQGRETIAAAMQYAQDYSARLTGTLVGRWRAGSYTGTRLLAIDEAAGGPLAIRLTATVEGEALTLDFAESDEQRPLFVNSPLGSTISSATAAVLTMLGDAVPANSGLLRAVGIRTRPGTVVDPVQPAPVGWGDAYCGSELANLVTETLGAAIETSLPHVSAPKSLALRRKVADRSKQTDLSCWAMGGSGGQPHADGWGQPPLDGHVLSPSVEQWESETDLMMERLEFAPDSGGAGQWTGAPAIEAVIRLDADGLYTLWTPPADVAAAGIEGGRAGQAGEVAIENAAGWSEGPRLINEVRLGADRLRLRLGGGGGYGDPARRDRAAVIDDLADGLISVAAARDVYKLDEQALAHSDDLKRV